MGLDAVVAVLALVVALVVGSFMGILRTTPNKRWFVIGNAWTELFRNIPLLVQISSGITSYRRYSGGCGRFRASCWSSSGSASSPRRASPSR